MENLVTRDRQEDMYGLIGLVEQDSHAQRAVTAPQKKVVTRSYHPTPLNGINRLLDLVDDYTGGKAGWVQRFVTYLCIGGFAAVVNLIIFFVVFYRIPMPVSNITHNVIASLFACEISIMANFIPNDYFTFRHLAGHNRTWMERCSRYHLTSIVGCILTFLIELGLTSTLHILAILAQAVALILVLVYNFSFHHIFTYRHKKA